MKSKTSSLGESLWVYVTRTPYILIRNDRLSMFSGSLISARKEAIKYIRLSPGYCPVESLPDATLSGSQMGKIHDAIVNSRLFGSIFNFGFGRLGIPKTDIVFQSI